MNDRRQTVTGVTITRVRLIMSFYLVNSSELLTPFDTLYDLPVILLWIVTFVFIRGGGDLEFLKKVASGSLNKKDNSFLIFISFKEKIIISKRPYFCLPAATSFSFRSRSLKSSSRSPCEACGGSAMSIRPGASPTSGPMIHCRTKPLVSHQTTCHFQKCMVTTNSKVKLKA